MSPPGATLPEPLPSQDPRGAARARIPGGQVRPGLLTPVMTAASPAGGMSSRGDSSSRSNSGAQRGPLMAPSGLRGGWGAVGGAGPGRARWSAERRESGLAGGWREPPGRYKGEPRRDSRRRPPGSTRGGHGAGTHPTPPRAHARPPRPGVPGTSTCRRAAPGGATQAAPPAGRPAPGPAPSLPPLASARRRSSHAPQPLCGLRRARSLPWFPKLHVLGAENLQLICCADV